MNEMLLLILINIKCIINVIKSGISYDFGAR